MPTFGEKLTELRAARGFTVDALADAADLPKQTVLGYIMDRRAPSFENAIKIAKALGVNLNEFVECRFVHEKKSSKSK
jgi:transcriptional regulator with XRE-family HTH domain